MKILILDIETSPNLAYIWSLWKQNIPTNHIVEGSEILSWSCKWLGSVSVWYGDKRMGYKSMLRRLANYMDEADIIVTHNGNKFDLPIIRLEFLKNGIRPPSPSHSIDTLSVAKREFRFASNSLSYIADQLKCIPKSKHRKYPGFELWKACMAGEEEAWKELEHYNIQDVLVTEEVYLKMRPYMVYHPNVAEANDSCSCPKCGSDNIQYRGYYTSKAGLTYHRFQCNSCGGWGREFSRDINTPRRHGRNAV